MTAKIVNGQRGIAAIAILLLALVGIAATGCSDDPDNGEQLSCSEHDDCEEGQRCIESLCEDFEPECAANADCDTGQLCEDEICIEEEIEDEDYEVSFLADGRTQEAEAELRFAANDFSGSHVVDTGDIDCDEARLCAISEDGTKLIAAVASASGDGFDLSATSVGGEPLEVQGDTEVFAEGVLEPRARGNGAVFERVGEGGDYYYGYFQEYDGDEIEVTRLRDLAGALYSKSWDVDPRSGRAMVFAPPTLEDLSIRVGTIDDGVSHVAELDSSNREGAAGSLYNERIPTAASADGRFIAFRTSGGPNDHEDCTNASGDASDDLCSQMSHRCGNDNRCYALEPTVHVIDMDYKDEIGESCSSHEDCGPVNRCDSGFEDFSAGTCQPQRIVVGLPKQEQDGVGGCMATRVDGSYRFTDIDGPLSFDRYNRVYFVGRRDCIYDPSDADTESEANIPPTSIVVADIETGEFEEVYGNMARNDYGIAGCGSGSGPGVIDDADECNIVIDSARLSPGGSDIVFTGTNPTIGSSGLATSIFDVWTVRRDGENPAWLGDLTGNHNATDIRVHGDFGDEPVDDDNGDGDSDE